MKGFMKICYKCEIKVEVAKTIKEGIGLNSMRCPKCREEYFTSAELIGFDRRKGINHL